MVSEAEKRRIGALIRQRRQALGLDQPGFARLVGVSRNAVYMWESGRSYPLRYAGKVEAVLAPFSLRPPDGHLEFDPDDAREARIASWADLTVARRQVMINELRDAKRREPRRTA